MIKKMLVVLFMVLSLNAQAAVLPPDILLGKELTVSDMNQLIPRIKRNDLRSFMQTAVTECTAKRWVTCHVALYDAEQSGMTSRANDSSGDFYNSSNDVKANQVWNGLMEWVSKDKKEYNDFHLQIKRKIKEEHIVPDLPAADGLHDAPVREMAIRIVQQYFQFTRIPYDSRMEMSRARAEWIRQLTLYAMTRGDHEGAYKGLELLGKYARMGNKKDAWVYKQTHYAVITYFKIMSAKPAK